jgi:hypothetical protein
VYSKACSADPAMLVITFAGSNTSDAEYGEVVQALQQLHRDADGRVALAIVVVANGHAAPNAYWRGRFAAVEQSRTGRHLFALVTESPLIRGVFTAVSWLMPEKTNYHGYAVSSFDAAVAAFEKMEGQPLDRLRVLFAEAEEDLRKRRRAAASNELGAI